MAEVDPTKETRTGSAGRGQDGRVILAWWRMRLSWRAAAGVLWSLLLAGYLIFNKPIALLGFPPLNIYIGEVALLGLLLVCAADFRAVLLEPLRRSWIFRLAAAFFLYGLLRAAVDFFDCGALALRDSVIAVYALAAFLAPAVWNAKPSSLKPQASSLKPLMRLLIPASLCGALWAAAVVYKYVDVRHVCGGFWSATKPDFLTVAAAVAFWVYAAAALRWAPWEPPAPRVALKALLVFAASVGLAFGCYRLMRRLPTRAVWLAVYPLAGICVLAWASTRKRLMAVAGLAGALVLTGALLAIPRADKAFNVVCNKYAPAKDLDFSLRKLEAELQKNPEVYPEYQDSLDLTDLDDEARRERELAMLSLDQNEFKTYAGERARDASEWRLLFWLRTWHYTLHHAPWFGLGFGMNLTNVNRRTPDLRSREPLAWRMFLPAMSLRNRNPHCAHLTVLARLGIIGLLIWLALLTAVLAGALRQCWRQRREMRRCLSEKDEAAAGFHRRSFWDGVTILGVWLIYLTAMSFGVVLENPFGGLWFWSLTGALGFWINSTIQCADDPLTR